MHSTNTMEKNFCQCQHFRVISGTSSAPLPRKKKPDEGQDKGLKRSPELLELLPQQWCFAAAGGAWPEGPGVVGRLRLPHMMADLRLPHMMADLHKGWQQGVGPGRRGEAAAGAVAAVGTE